MRSNHSEQVHSTLNILLMQNITEIIKEELSADGASGARELARSLIQKAREGNAAIAKLIFDRIEEHPSNDDEVLSEEEIVERVTAMLDRARKRKSQQAN